MVGEALVEGVAPVMHVILVVEVKRAMEVVGDGIDVYVMT